MPASVALSAAPMERLPERHKKTTGRSASPSVGGICCRSSSTKFALCAPADVFHSMNNASRPRLDRSGTPTNRHSASVRTSTSTALGLSLSSFHASRGEMSPAYDRVCPVLMPVDLVLSKGSSFDESREPPPALKYLISDGSEVVVARLGEDPLRRVNLTQSAGRRPNRRDHVRPSPPARWPAP